MVQAGVTRFYYGIHGDTPVFADVEKDSNRVETGRYQSKTVIQMGRTTVHHGKIFNAGLSRWRPG